MTVCTSCGRENPAGSRFCNACGAELGQVSGREQRKTVTVLFCDVVGSTALGERLDPERTRVLLARYFERMKLIVERYGGTVDKFIGDAVEAVFGLPLVHEDDALRACRAAMEMQQVVPALGLQARIGIATGEVVTGTAERLVTGDAVNVAARLEQAAQPGEVLIGEATLARVRPMVDVASVGRLELKGKAERVSACRLLSVLDAGVRSHVSRFVGRERELALIRAGWERTLSGERCELITVVGEAGVGKSRLVEETLAVVEARVVRGRCLPYGEGITYWPVVEVVKQLDAVPSEPAAEAAIRSLLGESERAASADEIAWAFRKLLEEQAPLVLVFDDLQWGEETFLDLVESTALLSSGAPLLLLCIARPELLERRPGWAGVFTLEPLGREHADALIGGEIAPDLRERIAHAAGGNPLFISEMLAMAAEDAEVEVPPSLKALLAMRLDQLDEAERKVLERGSVEGEIFHRGAVQALAPEETRVTMRLAALVRHQLVRPDRAQFAGDDGYRFRHLLIRDAAYDALPKATRADLHRRFATWLEQHGKDLVELDEIIGYHLERAVRYLAELGQADPVLAREAAGRLAAAGVRAYGRSDTRAARALLARSVALDEHPDVHLLVHYAAVEDSRPAALLLEEAARRAEVEGDAPGAALARAIAAHTRLETLEGSADEQKRLALEAVRLLEAVEDHEGLAAVWFSLGDGVYNVRCLYDEMEHAAEEGLRHAALAGMVPGIRAGLVSTALRFGSTPVADALERNEALAATYPYPGLTLIQATLLAMNDEIEAARSLAATSAERFRQLSDGPYAATMRADVEELAGDVEAASEFLRLACDRLASRGATSMLSTYAPLRGLCLCALDRYDEAEGLAEQGRVLGHEDDPITQSSWRRVSALVHAHRGELAEADRLAREAVAESRKTDSPQMQAAALADLAEVLHARNRSEEAAAVLRQALELYERKGIIPLVRRTRERIAAL